MRLTKLGDDWHIIVGTSASGDAGYRVTTACGLKDQPWDQTFIDQMPSGGTGGACTDCRVAEGIIEKPKKKRK